MAITCRQNAEELLQALVFAHNQLQGNAVTAQYHRDITQQTNGPLFDQSSIVLTTLVVSGSAVDLPSTIALANNILGVLNEHMADAQAHLKADFANAPVNVGLVNAVDLVSVQQLLNELKAYYNQHLNAPGVHVSNDTTNANSTALASSLATAETLANALKTNINNHMASGGSNFNSCRINIVSE